MKMRCTITTLAILCLGQASIATVLAEDNARGAWDAVSTDSLETNIQSEWVTEDVFAYGQERYLTFGLDLLLLNRSGADPQVVFSNGGVPTLTTADLDLSVEAGLRVDLILHGGSGTDLQFDYFGTEDFSASGTRRGAGTTFVFYGGVPAMPVDAYTVHYRSRLRNVELNLRRVCGPHLTLLAGLRGLELSEEFNIVEAAAPNLGFFSKTDNDLFGFQLGGELLLWTDGYIQLTAGAKTGIFNNSVEVYAQAVDSGTGLPIIVHRDSDHAAFLTEVTLGITIPMGPNAAVRFGYQALWLDGVALAPDQNNNFSLFGGAGRVDYGTPAYHGSYLGAYISF